MVAAPAEGLAMVELELVASRAAATAVVDKSALIPVSLADRAPHRGRDVAGRRRSVGLFEALSWGFRIGEPLRFESLELLGDGFFYDRSQIPVGYYGTIV